MDIILSTEIARWNAVLTSVDGFDFYHLPEYHSIDGRDQDSQAVLFLYQEGSTIAAWPFLIRTLRNVDGFESIAGSYRDATSVYGYPGPLCSSQARSDLGFAQRFVTALSGVARELQLVSLFSRLNPLMQTTDLIRGIGTTVYLGETISIDLTLSPAEQWSNYRKSHRYEISKARREGLRVHRDEEWAAFDKFYRLYLDTMKKNNASRQYLFDRDYFGGLRKALGHRIHLFTAEYHGEVCAASLFVHTGDIIQYHFSGSDHRYARLAPAKVIVDEARLWGNTVSARTLHLGGGVGASQDNLFFFKAGFSPIRHKFFVWKWIAQSDVYHTLVETRRNWLKKHGMELTSPGFFPLYRAH